MKYARSTRIAQPMWLCLAITLPLFLSSCFKLSNGTKVQTPSVSIVLSTSSQVQILSPGGTLNIAATVYDQTGQGVTWNLAPVNFGTLTNTTSSSVTYTAPTDLATPTAVTVTATSITNPNITAKAGITVNPLITIAVITNPATNLQSYSGQIINQGAQLQIIAISPATGNNVDATWSLSPASGAGSLSSPTGTVVTYVAPSAVVSPTSVTVTAQLPGSSATGNLQITVFPSGAAANMTTVEVNGGPVPGQVYPNAAFTSVTLCNPGSYTCQTIDGILVDTGSSGLRVLQSEIPFLSVHSFVDGNGNTLDNCDALVDGSYLWGPVSLFDIYVNGETATSVPVQVVSSAEIPVPTSCSNGGTNENTPQLLGANGILGVGPEPTDCVLDGTNYCDGSSQPTPPNLYYTCPSVGCATNDSAVIVNRSQQVANPIPFFSSVDFGTDTNGVILQFPPVSGNETSVSGTMIFGIGTEPDNALGTATVFTLDSSDQFTTVFGTETLTSSFIDSGSNGFFFPDSLPVCSVNTQYFCPSSLTNLSATNTGATQGEGLVSFSVDNADSLLSTYPSEAAFGTLAGPEGMPDACANGEGSCTFDWGLPFFFGRSVYTAIDGQTPPSGFPEAPWWAY